MEIRKILLISSVLVIWIISGNLAHSYTSGRAAKILEDPIVPQDWNHDSSREKIILKDSSDRSLTVENNMMLYRSVFTLSLKLLSVFLIFKLFTYGLGLVRPKAPVVPLYPNQQLLYTVDVNHNPIPTTLVTQGTTNVGVAAVTPATGVVPQAIGGYIAPAATNPRPSFLLPRFRFGGPRHPPVRPRHPHPPPGIVGPGGVTQYNMGEENYLVETHSHVYVMPDGTQARVPYPTTVVSSTVHKPASSAPQATSQSSDTNDAKPSADSAPAASSASDVTTEKATSSVESVSISTSSSSSSSAERRSSPVFREKQQPLHHQHYTDWSLHFNPGTR